MIILRCCDWFRRSPFFLLSILWLHVHCAKAETLVTLAKDPCLQPCYMQACPDLEANCVCNSLLDSESFTNANLCAQEYCNQTKEKSAFPKLVQECSARVESPGPPSKSSKEVSMTRGGLASIIPTTLPDLVSLTETPTATPRSRTSREAASTSEPAYPSELGTISTIPSPTPTPTPTGGPDLQDGPFTAEPQVTEADTNRSNSLIAAYVLAPLSVVIILVAFVLIWRRRKYSRRSIGSFAGVKGWDSSQVAIADPMGGGNDEEKAARFPPQGTSQASLPPPVRRPSMARRKDSFPVQLADKALPQLPPVQRPISTISEVSLEVSPVLEDDIEAFQTMDSELQRAFLEVRRGFWPSPSMSSARTSVSWSVTVDRPQTPE